MTTSLVEGGGAGKEEEEEQGAMYGADNLFNIAGGEATSLYIVSEGVREYNNGGINREGLRATYYNVNKFKKIRKM